MATFDTVANVVSKCAIELGLGAVSDVFGSTDENVIQLRTLLESAGRQLVKETRWLQTTREHTFATTAATSYNLPSDYARMVDGTGWNRTQRLPIRPVSPTEWQFLQAGVITAATAVLFRPNTSTLSVWPTSNTGDTMAFEYISTFWVRSSGAPSPDLDAPAANTDTIHIDSLLIQKALRLAWVRAKGFDTTTAQDEYDAAYKAAQGLNAGAARTLSVTPRADDEVLGHPSAISTQGAFYP